MAAWIPAEAIGLFVAFAGFFSVFDATSEELALGGVVAVITVAYAAQSSVSAQKARGLTGNVKSQAIKTAGIALVAFLAWWVAMPGSFATDPRNLGLNPFWPAILVAVVALGLPFAAGWLGVEPLHGNAAE